MVKDMPVQYRIPEEPLDELKRKMQKRKSDIRKALAKKTDKEIVDMVRESNKEVVH